MFRNWLAQVGLEGGGHASITGKFEQMLEDGRHVFDLAANALLAGGDAEVIRDDLFTTDERINATEQRIRRQLVVHGSIHGAAHFPELLVMMSLVKDAERIGDYAKNLYDLAARRADLGGGDERDRLVDLKDRVSKLLVRARNIYDEQDEGSARTFLSDADRLEDECDAAIHRLLAVKGTNPSGAVLTYRYFKRVAGHASNIVTSLVMPVDKLDFFDEPKV